MARSLKKDRRRTNKKVLPYHMKNKYSKTMYDYSGYDTKKRRQKTPRKVHTGKRGGRYIMYKGQKRYLRK